MAVNLLTRPKSGDRGHYGRKRCDKQHNDPPTDVLASPKCRGNTGWGMSLRDVVNDSEDEVDRETECHYRYGSCVC